MDGGLGTASSLGDVEQSVRDRRLGRTLVGLRQAPREHSHGGPALDLVLVFKGSQWQEMLPCSHHSDRFIFCLKCTKNKTKKSN